MGVVKLGEEGEGAEGEEEEVGTRRWIRWSAFVEEIVEIPLLTFFLRWGLVMPSELLLRLLFRICFCFSSKWSEIVLWLF